MICEAVDGYFYFRIYIALFQEWEYNTDQLDLSNNKITRSLNVKMTVTIITAVYLCIVEFVIILLVAPMAKPSMILGYLPENIREKAKNHPGPPKGYGLEIFKAVSHSLIFTLLQIILPAYTMPIEYQPT